MNTSAVIVNWNSGSCLRRLLRSLIPLENELTSIVVLDNASGDESLQQLPPLRGLEIVRLESNRGFAGAANLGIQRVQDPFVLLMNPDVEVVGDSVRRLIGRLQADSRIAVACGPLRHTDGRLQTEFQFRPLPTPVGVLWTVLLPESVRRLISKNPGVRGSVSEAISEDHGGEDVEQPAAAFWLLRREAWKQLDGFDETFYPAWFEDVDFCRRLIDAHWKLRYYPDLPVLHTRSISLGTLSRSRFLSIYYGNLLRYLRKHHPWAYPWLWLPVRFGCSVRKAWGKGSAP